jgi:hypothetical protein
MPPVYSTSRWKAKLQLLQLSNISCSYCNLVAHITIRVSRPQVPGRPFALGGARRDADLMEKHGEYLRSAQSSWPLAGSSRDRCAV